MTALQTLQFLSVFFAGISTGTWVVTQLALIPARKALPAKSGIEFFLGIEREIARFNGAFVAASGLSALLILLLRLSPTDTAALFAAVGCVGSLGATLISLLWNRPIRQKMASWQAGSVPPEYPGIQQEWDRGNLARTALGLMALASYVLAVL